MTELTWLFWLFVGGPIVLMGVIALGFIWLNEIRFKREMAELLNEHRGWD